MNENPFRMAESRYVQ